MLQRFPALLLIAPVMLAAAKPPALALLENRCAGCHNATARKSGLDVTTRATLLRGGDRGPGVVPGKSAESLVYKSASHTIEPAMPYQMAKLTDAELAQLASWIDSGAPFENTITTLTMPAEALRHWAFQKPVRPTVPRAAANPVDFFLAAERTGHGLTAAPEADPRTLVRRLYLDLAGMPPTRDELHAALTMPHEKLVDRLLADPRYGERWGRHWMDVWRYSDWYGYRRSNEVRNSARHIWRWRDWIVESLNSDKGYDRMIVEMLAGDEVAPTDPQVVRATGFLARNYSRFDRHGWMQDAVDHTAQAFLGVTLKCARCHDHKYDPFSQEEYYRFRAFFEPYEVRTDRVPGELDAEKDGLARIFDAEPSAKTWLLIRGDIASPDKEHPLEPVTPASLGGAGLKVAKVALPVESYAPDHRAFVHADLVKQAQADIEKAEMALKEAKDENAARVAAKTLAAAKAFLPALEARIAADQALHAKSAGQDALIEKARKAERAAGVLKADESLLRAQIELTAALAATPANEKRVTEAKKKLTAATESLTLPPEGHTPIGKSYPEHSSGRRLALAQWITQRDNPLTARVAVNHIWLRHFGTALVPTVTDFGRNGKPATHPQLLDWLATELMESGWSMKRIHRLIVTSKAYRMRSTTNEANAKLDPDNRYLWRMNSRRMEAEAVRDSVLQAAGTLDLAMGGADIAAGQASQSRRRSLYLQHSPDAPVQFLKTFDSANQAECYERTETVVPHQALALANSEFSREQAKALTKRLADAGQQPAQFVAAAFESVLGRPPAAAELAAASKFLRTDADREDLVHVLLNHNDFVTIR